MANAKKEFIEISSGELAAGSLNAETIIAVQDNGGAAVQTGDTYYYVKLGSLPTLLASSLAPVGATYIVQTADGDLTNEQALGALATGLVKNTTTTGVLSIAAEGTDYYGPAGTDIPLTDGGTGASDAATARTNLAVVALAGDTMTGQLNFSGTTHAGIKLLSLTTAQRDALTPANGMIIYNSDDDQVQGYVDSSWGQIGGGGASITLDTRANILATATPASGSMYYATDTEEFAIYDGTDFQFQPVEFKATSTTPDIGLQPPNVANDLAGYAETYIVDKLIAHSRIGSNDNTNEGDIRVSDGTFQIYLSSTWNDVVTGFRFREDSAGNYELEHKPIGFTLWYEVMSGNSDQLSLSGLPVFQEYQTDMGAYQTPLVVRSRSFT